MNGSIRYTVKVTTFVERVEIQGSDWKQVGEEIDKESGKPKAIFGHTPKIEKTVQREVAIYEQTVDELDLKDLILAVNGIAAE